MNGPAVWAAEGWFSSGSFLPTALRWHDSHRPGCASHRGVCLGTGCPAGARLCSCFQRSWARPWGVQLWGMLEKGLGFPLGAAPLGPPAA